MCAVQCQSIFPPPRRQHICAAPPPPPPALLPKWFGGCAGKLSVVQNSALPYCHIVKYKAHYRRARFHCHIYCFDEKSECVRCNANRFFHRRAASIFAPRPPAAGSTSKMVRRLCRRAFAYSNCRAAVLRKAGLLNLWVAVVASRPICRFKSSPSRRAVRVFASRAYGLCRFRRRALMVNCARIRFFVDESLPFRY